MKYVTFLLTVILTLCVGVEGHAQSATLLSGYGGPMNFGTDVLPPGDDESSGVIDLTPAFPSGLDFYGTTFRSLHININGNLSFGGPLRDFTPRAFPGAPLPMIAAWWADVDTRGATIPNAGIYWAFTTNQLIVTWYAVGYFDQHHDRNNTFQIVLTRVGAGTTARDFDIEFRYNRCEWTTGDMSGGEGGVGGIPATAGYEAPSAAAPIYSTLPGSGTTDVLRLCNDSNVESPGVWQFHVRNGVVAYCGNDVIEMGEQCDGPMTPPGFLCSESCELCGGDSGIPCGPTPNDAGPDATPDSSVPSDAAMEASMDAALPDAPPPDVLPDVTPDASADIVSDVVPEAAPEPPPDVSPDVQEDPTEASLPDPEPEPAMEASVDAEVDASEDVSTDAGLDASIDVAQEASMDAAVDATTMDASTDTAAEASLVVSNYGGGGLLQCNVRTIGSRFSLQWLALLLLVAQRRRKSSYSGFGIH